jgi:hypothetical protein
MGDGIVVGSGSVEEIGNRFESGGYSSSLLSCEAPVFEPPLKGSGRRRVPGRQVRRPIVDEYTLR